MRSRPILTCGECGRAGGGHFSWCSGAIKTGRVPDRRLAALEKVAEAAREYRRSPSIVNEIVLAAALAELDKIGGGS